MGKETGDYLILAEFPNSQTAPFYITSLPDDCYNCVAWVLGNATTWYEPDEDYSMLGVIDFLYNSTLRYAQTKKQKKTMRK